MLSAVCKVLKGLLKINATQLRGHVVMFHDNTKLGGTRIINKTEKESSVQNTFQRERSTRCRGRCKSKSLLMEISQLEVFVTVYVQGRYVTNNRGHCIARAMCLLKKSHVVPRDTWRCAFDLMVQV